MQLFRKHLVSMCGGALLVASATAGFAQQQPYQVLDHWKVGGTGGWDYLLADPAAHLLYITHGPRVEVVDTTTGKSVGAVTGMKSTHGVALNPDGKVGYASDGAGNAVVVFDRTTFATIATVPAGTNPDGITFEPVTNTVWAFNGRSKNVTVIDPASNTVVATIALPGKPEFPQPDGKGNIFVNIEDKNSIVALDAKEKKMTGTWPLTGCESPSGLAIDHEHERVFAVCDGKKMAVVDTKAGKQIASADIGEDPDAAGYNAKDELAFSSNGDGTLSVVDTAHGFKTIQTVKTAKGARTMSYDESTDRLYLITAEYGAAPAATAAVPHPRPTIVPDTFTVVVVGRK